MAFFFPCFIMLSDDPNIVGLIFLKYTDVANSILQTLGYSILQKCVRYIVYSSD